MNQDREPRQCEETVE